MNDLFDWVSRKGGYVHPALVRRTTGIPGMVTCEKIFRGSDILRIPRCLSIVAATIPDLAALVMDTSTKNSWDEYLKALPSWESFEDHPLFYTEETLKTLAQMDLPLASCLTQNQELFREQIRCLQAEENAPSFNEAAWALLIAKTRSWNVKDQAFLIPVMDNFNHRNDAMKPAYRDTSACWELTATTDIQENEEIFLSYGCKDVYTLFLHYGFVDETNLNFIKIPRTQLFLSSAMQYYRSWEAKKQYNLQLEVNDKALFILLDHEKMVFTDKGPSLVLMNLETFSFQ